MRPASVTACCGPTIEIRRSMRAESGARRGLEVRSVMRRDNVERAEAWLGRVLNLRHGLVFPCTARALRTMRRLMILAVGAATLALASAPARAVEGYTPPPIGSPNKGLGAGSRGDARRLPDPGAGQSACRARCASSCASLSCAGLVGSQCARIQHDCRASCFSSCR